MADLDVRAGVPAVEGMGVVRRYYSIEEEVSGLREERDEARAEAERLRGALEVIEIAANRRAQEADQAWTDIEKAAAFALITDRPEGEQDA